MNSVNVLAKLLANENITVLRSDTDTAEFDIEKRILTIPSWENLSERIEHLFVAHEIAHALWTTDEYIPHVKDDLALMDYFNVCEDVRIEKLVKRKYPGVRRDFLLGYKELREMDFFGLSKVENINELYLIDRINIHFKNGFDLNIQFSAEEQQFVTRAENLETMGDAIQLAKDLLEYQRKESEKEEQNEGQSSGIQEVTTYESQKIFMENIETDGKIHEHYILPEYDIDIIIPFEEILGAIKNENLYMPKEYLLDHEQAVASMKPIVSYLYKEFQLRQSSAIQRRAKQARTGVVDVRKLWGHKVREDIFKAVTVLPEGKNHGMLFLLDFSGSMSEYIGDVLNQVSALSMFCRMASIPFRVFAFSSNSLNLNPVLANLLSKQDLSYRYKKANVLGFHDSMFLLELFSSNMTKNEFNEMLKYCLVKVQIPLLMKSSCVKLGSTPLVESLVYLAQQEIPKFIRRHGIEKCSLITMTDGANDHPFTYSIPDRVPKYRKLVDNKWKKVVNHIVDQRTHKTYEVYADTNMTTSLKTNYPNIILEIIKDRYGVNVFGFYIGSNRKYRMEQALEACSPEIPFLEFNDKMASYTIPDKLVNEIREECDSKGAYKMPSLVYDGLYYIKSIKVNDEDYDIVEGESALKIAKKFTAQMKGKIMSRVLMNKFIEVVA